MPRSTILVNRCHVVQLGHCHTYKCACRPSTNLDDHGKRSAYRFYGYGAPPCGPLGCQSSAIKESTPLYVANITTRCIGQFEQWSQALCSNHAILQLHSWPALLCHLSTALANTIDDERQLGIFETGLVVESTSSRNNLTTNANSILEQNHCN